MMLCACGRIPTSFSSTMTYNWRRAAAVSMKEKVRRQKPDKLTRRYHLLLFQNLGKCIRLPVTK